MNPPGVRLGRVLGVPVRLAPSWFVIAGVVVLVFGPQVQDAVTIGPVPAYLVAAAYALLLLGSVMLHELAHAMAARALGMPVHEIVADLWGGHTQFEDAAPSPGRSAFVAVVGPIANAALAVLGWVVIALVTPQVVAPDDPQFTVLRLLVVALIYSNVFVAVFNLAPGLPLDGGRVVESVVWAITGRRATGTIVAGWSGRLVAVAVVAWWVARPVLAGRTPSAVAAVWAVMIAALLWQGAGAAITAGRVRRGVERLDLAAYTTPARGLAASSADWSTDTGAVRQPVGTVLVALDDAGSPVGLLTPQDARTLLDGLAPPPPGTALSAVMTVLSPAVVLRQDADPDDTLHALTASTTVPYVLVDDLGQVTGVVDSARIAERISHG
ncbi:MAG: site-2 protease family protein [Angustibacter sp.]